MQLQFHFLILVLKLWLLFKTCKTFGFARLFMLRCFYIMRELKMSSVEKKTFATEAAEVMEPNNAKVEIVNVGGNRVMKIAAQPGWVWSKDIKPLVGTESCQAKHLGVIVEGTITCRHDDGSEITYSAGDAYSIEPGHDAWVVGNTKAVAYEFHGLWGEAG